MLRLPPKLHDLDIVDENDRAAAMLSAAIADKCSPAALSGILELLSSGLAVLCASRPSGALVLYLGCEEEEGEMWFGVEPEGFRAVFRSID